MTPVRVKESVASCVLLDKRSDSKNVFFPCILSLLVIS